MILILITEESGRGAVGLATYRNQESGGKKEERGIEGESFLFAGVQRILSE
ncbi:MAG: hypothetical protein F6K18_13845 [Okeania sp. SIO2C2]|uniref:hypothetical protein n=1 Tax=Okeania sp. SIO2C2 TaxID=2607787 RepID=UPI0013B9053A|nr:hypothetical protein [Okeania sp. SIO2C2]NEP87812.1 hypothetical protein [Okeania sp. SIO2C2]